MTKQFWKTFVVVFVVAFAVNVVVAYIFSRVLPDSSWSWDTTTTTSVMLALFVAYISRRNNHKI